MDVLKVLEVSGKYHELIVCTVLFFVTAAISWGLFPKRRKGTNGNESYKSQDFLLPLLFVVLAGFISLIILAYLQKFSERGFSNTPDAWGQAGDFFGGMLNPILAFASFIALLYTIRIQSEEMRDTREEAKLSRLAAQNSASSASRNLTQQELLEAYKGLESIFRARNSEAKPYYYQEDDWKRSLHSVLSNELSRLEKELLDKAKEANKNKSTGQPAVDWENVKVSPLSLKKAIVTTVSPYGEHNAKLYRTAKQYSITAHYSFQAYKELIKVTKDLSTLDGLMGIYAQELAHDLLFSALCYDKSVISDAESLKNICPRLSVAIEELYRNLNLLIKDEPISV